MAVNEFKLQLYTPLSSTSQNAEAFTNGGATHNSVNDTSDGVGAGADEYQYYSGDWSTFPELSSWVSFDDMWEEQPEHFQDIL